MQSFNNLVNKETALFCFKTCFFQFDNVKPCLKVSYTTEFVTEPCGNQ